MTGTVTNVTDFGLFLELEEGIEGLVHISEISGDRRGNPLSRFQVDDVIQAKVLNVSREDKKIGLSIRKLEETTEKEIYRSYLNSSKEATSNLGELLREEMMSLGQQAFSEKPEPAEEQHTDELAHTEAEEPKETKEADSKKNESSED